MTFKGDKIRSTPLFGREVKLEAPCRNIFIFDGGGGRRAWRRVLQNVSSACLWNFKIILLEKLIEHVCQFKVALSFLTVNRVFFLVLLHIKHHIYLASKLFATNTYF
jgi:hypothetical protein